MVTKPELTEALSKQAEEIQKKLDESVSKIRGEIIDRLTEEKKKLHDKLDLQEKRITDLEKRFEVNLQYQRFSSVLVSGIPTTVEHQNLEGIVLNIFNSICYHKISQRYIIAVHRVSKSSPKVLVKFVNKRDATSFLDGKIALSNLNKNLPSR